MFQRLKGAIDTRIAEEQARQRQATQTTPGRQPVRRRPQNQDGTSARSPARPREPVSIERGPDPTEFEADLAEDDDVVKSEVKDTTEPASSNAERQEEKNGTVETPDPTDSRDPALDGAEKRPEGTIGSPVPSDKAFELPTEVRVRLRKLDRLENKYGELLKAYRTAHARVQIIESFETSLKENTPLTSIADPSALVEYLNQVKLKGDMVLDEFKKVSAERDNYKKKQELLENDNTSLHAEVADLKHKVANAPAPTVVQNGEQSVQEVATAEPAEATSKDMNIQEQALKSPASTASRIPSISMFSPRFGARKDEPRNVPEDLFSYDSEVPRLEHELQERIAEVSSLNRQVTSLQNDLKVARESTEGMVQTLEITTDELNTLRDTNDKLESIKSDLQKRAEDMEKVKGEEAGQVEALQSAVHELEKQRDGITASSEELQRQIQVLETTQTNLRKQLSDQSASAEILNEKLSQKDQIVKDLEDSLAMAKRAELEQADGQSTNQKRLATMQGIMDNVRVQLTDAERVVTELKQELEAKQSEFANRPSSKVFGFLDEGAGKDIEVLKTREDAVNYLANAFELHKSESAMQDLPAQPAPIDIATGGAGKKKNNKKKKKGGKGQQSAIEAARSTPEAYENNIEPNAGAAKAMEELRQYHGELIAEVEDKTETIERLSAQIKDQDGLREEIETLRDDLLHQGEEHVEARDALKTATEERRSLQTKVEELEKELDDVRNQLTSSAEQQQLHSELSKSFEELKMNFTAMETDLKAAEQLAAARFKDISDLKDLLTKAQPELRNLRSEVAELNTIKDDFKNKQGELHRLAAKHDDLKTEIKGLARRLSEKDSDIKTLQEKIEQESKARSKVEIELTSIQSELRVSESRRVEVQETSSRTTQELTKSKEDALSLRTKLRDLEEQLVKQTREASSLREEVSLKIALHTSSQSSVQSLRDQTQELSTQAREALARAESLEEELAETQRMLSERTREGSTMRMLLNQAESGTESRLREMKERMDAAIEERDRTEDEANVTSRRTMRELEEAKTKARDALRQHTALEDERDDLINKTREWRRRREELEQATESATKEVTDIKAAMQTLREALNESERQIHEAETSKTTLRHQTEEANDRVDKLTRANKTLTEELKSLHSSTTRKTSVRPIGATTDNSSGLQSSRTSLDSSSARSPTPVVRPPSNKIDSNTGLSQATVDYVYLKNVLLQFMERKDKSHQRQLIPVLGMLLHFDRTDEQKWNSAISAR